MTDTGITVTEGYPFLSEPAIYPAGMISAKQMIYASRMIEVILMAKGRVYISNYPDNPPEWYWINGLHDACILDVEVFEFPFDYNKFAGEKNKNNSNLMILKIDAKGALYDNTVKEIRFFNYETLTDLISLEGRKKVWWLADRLVDCGSYYTLEINLQDFDSYHEDFTFKIKFERAEVDR